MTTLLLPTDGCPECISPDPVHPHRVGGPGDGPFRAEYRCPVCGYNWSTYWTADALTLPCPGCPACTNTRGAVA